MLGAAMLTRAGLVLVLATACAADDGDGAADTSTSAVSTTAGTSAGATTTITGPNGSSTAAAESSGDAGGSSTGAALQPCGLADLSPGAPDPIDAGTAAMQIPPDIAAIQLASCGCHLTDELDDTIPDYGQTGPFDMRTWAGFQALRAGDMMPWHAIALDYVQTEFMPLSAFCDVGGGLHMDPDARATLVAWLTAGAPDGATWVP